MNFKRGAIVAVLIASLLAVAACGSAGNTSGSTGSNSASSESGQKCVKPTNVHVGLVTDVGGLDDHGFNSLAYQGMQEAKCKLGVQVDVIQSKQQSDYVPNLTKLADQGDQLVVAVGFLMIDALHQVAPKYPDTKFGIIDVLYNDVVTDSGQDKTATADDYKNVAGSTFKTEQCGYMVGVLSALLEKNKSLKGLTGSHTYGVVGGISIPPVNSYIAGFQQAIAKYDPQGKVIIKWAQAFDDPAKGKALTDQEYQQGAEIVFQVAGGTGVGVINAAKDKNLYAIGVDADQNYLAPNNVISSAMKGVDTATFDFVKSTVGGTFKAGDYTFDLANGGVGVGVYAKGVPQSIVDQVNQAADDIKSGKITVSAELQK